MQLNNTAYVDRHNKPSVIAKVGLRAHFINDGVYTDPYEISGVTIFAASSNFTPSSVLDETGLIASTIPAARILMHFGVDEGLTTQTTATAFAATNYTPGTTASGIFRESAGKYIVMLDGSLNLSGVYYLHGSALEVGNGASAVGDYLDVWTVRYAQGSLFKSVINDFSLRSGTFVVVTEPLLLTSRHRLMNKYIKYGSKVDLKVGTEIGIANRETDESVKNLFRDTLITSASMQIEKHNEERNLPARVVVSAHSDTSSLIDITSDNTIILNWDTSLLPTHAQTTAGNMGSLNGPYEIQVKYTLLNETIYSPWMRLIVH